MQCKCRINTHIAILNMKILPSTRTYFTCHLPCNAAAKEALTSIEFESSPRKAAAPALLSPSLVQSGSSSFGCTCKQYINYGQHEIKLNKSCMCKSQTFLRMNQGGKKGLHLDLNVHFPVSSFENFLLTTFALRV